jgi:hypothetical protein
MVTGLSMASGAWPAGAGVRQQGRTIVPSTGTRERSIQVFPAEQRTVDPLPVPGGTPGGFAGILHDNGQNPATAPKVFTVVMKPGSRIPAHFHTNGWEINYVGTYFAHASGVVHGPHDLDFNVAGHESGG